MISSSFPVRKSHRALRLLGLPLTAGSLVLGGCVVATPWLLTSPALAQNTNATIRGQVLDPAGAFLPGAKIVILNKNTGVTVYSGTSDSAGAFVAPQVIPGTYKVTVDATGFKESVADDLVATVAQVVSINVNMQVGAVSDVVSVSAEGIELERSSSEISTLITPADVQNVPLVGRAPENLLAFIPGVAHGGAGDTPSTSQLSINGSRTLNSDFLLNGVSLIIASTGTALALPSPDGIDQFRLLSTNAPAEYGRTAGAVLSANTNSGTNTFHGNVYYLMRNEDFDANTYFNKLKPIGNSPYTPRAKDRFFQVGGSLGGPVRIPKIYNGRDKTFFFVNYDYTIQPSTSSFTDTVPTAAQRTGDLSAALAGTSPVDGSSRTAVKVYAPGTSVAYANNQIGPIDPAAAKILALVPLPNTTGTYDKTNNRYTSNWTTQQNNTSNYLRLEARVDEQITTRDRVSVNLYRYTNTSPNAVNYNQDASGKTLSFATALLNTTWDCSCSNAWLPSVDYTRTWSDTLVMDLNMGFFRYATFRNPPGTHLSAASATGIASLPLDQMPELTSPGFSNLGADTNTNQINITNTYTPFGSITKIWGPHTFKIGASLRKNQFNSYNPASSPEGNLSFDGSITNQGATGNATTGLADFLLGKIKTGSYEQPQPPTGRRNWNVGVFLQDDYKATSKLTLNLGIRWEYESPLTIAHNIYSRFDPATGQMLAAGINASPSLNINTPKNDFSPRVGLAYSVDQKTVIRAAFGTFFGTIFQNLGGQVAFPGFDNNISYNNLGTGVAQPFSLSQGFPLTAAVVTNDPRQSPVYLAATDSSPYSISGVEFNYMSKMPVVEQWNLGFQRQLPLALTLEVNYVGNHAVHLPYNVPYNIVPLSSVDAVTLANTTKASQDAKPYPTLASWTGVDHVGNSNYNALQATVRRDFSKSLAVLSNYTYAKSMDDGSTIYNFSAPFGTANAQYTATGAYRAKDFTVSNIDATHTLNIVMIYTTAGPWWLKGWHISPVFVGHTGLPFNITQSGEISNVSQQRPNGDPSHLKLANPYLNGAALQYLDNPVIDTSSFPLTPSGPVYTTINGVRTRIVSTGFGNVPRDSNRAPGEVDFDASISKDFQVWKALKFQLRLDAFNVINHTNFTQPNSSLSVTTTANSTAATFLSSSTFGQITGTQPARKLQISGRFFF
ncbi:TonB-dependent Receptor Plug Domain [Bryocella elongata]|uniref:TonB-dependent Receptor Plug Domain n=1 Tax=Bryocella elongata TaxID=863522 RepID=A0A1H6C3D6_9BACT|nr:carboxypeptidase regulatory-like domain-containing protein [Bryocella elongata]SEG67155.1 TonB-dependent Receptor Plug Domain [Bryocella elongata]